MDYSILIFTIVKLALLMGIGMWLTKKLNFTTDVRRFLIFVIINITLPALILNGFLQLTIDNTLMKEIAIVFIFSVAFNVIGLLCGWSFAKMIGLPSVKARETGFLSIFGNTGLIGIPLCAALFGPKGAVLAAVFDAGMSLTLWTVGVLFIQGKRNITLKNIASMISVPNVAVILGITIALLNINVGYFVKDFMSTLAAVASPLAMLYIGMVIMTIIKAKKKISVKLLATPFTFKLLIFPLVGIFVLSFLPFSKDVQQVLLIEMAMPAITTASIIFALYNADEEYSVMHTLFTNIFALITVPFLVFIGSVILL